MMRTNKFSKTFQSTSIKKMLEKADRLKKSHTPQKGKSLLTPNKKCKRCRILLEEKDELKEENDNLKEIQRILMKRLKQQDKYIEQCLFKKQEEIDKLINEIESFKQKCFIYENKNEQLEKNISTLISHMHSQQDNLAGGKSPGNIYLDLDFTLNSSRGAQPAEEDVLNHQGDSKTQASYGVKQRKDHIIDKMTSREMMVIQEESESEEDLDYIATLNAKSENNEVKSWNIKENEIQVGDKNCELGIKVSASKLRRCQSDSIGQRTDRSSAKNNDSQRNSHVVLGLKPDIVKLLSKFNEVDFADLVGDCQDNQDR